MMQVQQLGVKLFARDGAAVDQTELTPIFHRWIREDRLPGRLLIDVADYRHVHHGPGIMIVGHEAHYAMDEAEGRLGLAYHRRRDPLGDVSEKLAEASREALVAADALEQEPSLTGRLGFYGDRVLVRVLSRLATPDLDAAWREFEPAVLAFGERLWAGAKVEVTRTGGAKGPLGAELRSGEDAALETLLSRV
jgi:hypothetical protein